MSSISSHPGAGVFRTNIVIIIIAIFISVFFYTIDDISNKAAEIAREKVLGELKYSLSMTLYDYTIKGQQAKLQKFDGENPFLLQAIYRSLPSNYHGTFRVMPEELLAGWYFDLGKRVVIYVDLEGGVEEYRMRYLEGGKGVKKLEVTPEKVIR